MLSATPIEVSPEDLYICMKLLDPSVWPNIQGFRNRYAKSFSTFSPWQVAKWDVAKLQEMAMRISHLTHQANKYRDPEIRSEFPEEHWEDIIIEMSDQDRKLYKKTLEHISTDNEDYSSILTKMAVLQMICNNPVSVNKSDGLLAQKLSTEYNFTDKFSTKLETLKDMLTQIDGKVVLFSMYSEYGSKMLAPYLAQWGHTFVLYDGKQQSQDTFKNDPSIKIFLSSDKGSDSINLQEATTVINYDLPWNYSTLEQRVNRINRITSDAAHVFYYNFIMENTIEERKLKLLQRKKEYQQAVFDGDIGDQAEIIAGSTLDDLKWLLS
jgi:SNF2 family DNA or RNA helicase